jgi:peptidoglycan/xylan/chitin deacetylase (PgdA/CDA1 family)
MASIEMTTHQQLPRVTASLIRRIGDAIAPRGVGEGRLCIVNYHRVLATPDPLLESEPSIATFRWQLALLKQCFNVVRLADAVQTMATGRMPPRAVAITFDDGYRSTHDLALPILQEFGLPATVFVTTSHIEAEGSMWNDVILEAVRRLPATPIDLRALGLGVYQMQTPLDRKATAHALVESCKYLPPTARTSLTGTLQALASNDLQQDLMLSAEMVRTLSRNQVDIGGHTVSHPILTRVDDDVARREIVDNKQHLEAIIGKPVTLFAYPNGKRGVDYDVRHVEMVREAGYHAAFTTATGAATRHDHAFELPRSRPWDRGRLMFAGRLLSWLNGRNT